MPRLAVPLVLALAGCALTVPERSVVFEPVAATVVERVATSDGPDCVGEMEADPLGPELLAEAGTPLVAGYANLKRVDLDVLECTRWRHNAVDLALRYDLSSLPPGAISGARVLVAQRAVPGPFDRVLRPEACDFALIEAATGWTPLEGAPGAPEDGPERADIRFAITPVWRVDEPRAVSLDVGGAVRRAREAGGDLTLVVGPEDDQLWRRIDAYCGVEIESAELVVSLRPDAAP